MLNDKLIIEMSCNYVYRLNELKNSQSQLNIYLKENYPDIKIIDIQEPFKNTNLNVISIIDEESKDVAIIYQGSSNMNDWKNDNLNNFLNKNVAQYESALKYFEMISQHNYRVTHVAGNSLGGGSAQYVALRHPHVKALCINASPLSHANFNDAKNIVQIRVNSDPLYRSVMLDKQRYDNAYAGSIFLVNRSLFGSYNYYNSIELAHRGSICFPFHYINKEYGAKNLKELKEKVDPKKYLEFHQLLLAPSLAQFLSFDLITNDLQTRGAYSFDTLQNNYASRIVEIENSLLKYHLTNLELKIGTEFLIINDTIGTDLKSILKHSLLHVTKQDSQLFENVYFIIEKSTNYFYKKIANELNEISLTIKPNVVSDDYEKIIKDIQINKDSINTLIDSMVSINDILYDFDKFKFSDYFKSYKTPEFFFEKQEWSLDYNKLIFKKIDTAINANIVKNKSFVEQIELFIFTALKATQISLSLPFVKNNKNLKPEDLDYIINNYSLSEILAQAMDIFKNDLYEAILANSLFYQYQANIICIIEQLEQVLITLNNLKGYLKDNESKYKTRKVFSIIDENVKYIENLIEYNKSSIVIDDAF